MKCIQLFLKVMFLFYIYKENVKFTSRHVDVHMERHFGRKAPVEGDICVLATVNICLTNCRFDLKVG